MYFDISQIFGLAGSIVGLAIVAVLVVNGTATANIIGASGKAFTDAITAASKGGKK